MSVFVFPISRKHTHTHAHTHQCTHVEKVESNFPQAIRYFTRGWKPPRLCKCFVLQILGGREGRKLFGLRLSEWMHSTRTVDSATYHGKSTQRCVRQGLLRVKNLFLIYLLSLCVYCILHWVYFIFQPVSFAIPNL